MAPYSISFPGSQVISLFCGLGLSGIGVLMPLAPARAEFVPPDRGTPGRLEGAGTRWRDPNRGEFDPPDQPLFDTVRGSCATTPEADGLTLLAPRDALGLTLNEYPRFFAYIPPLPDGAQIEFAVTEWERLMTDAGGRDARSRSLFNPSHSPEGWWGNGLRTARGG